MSRLTQVPTVEVSATIKLTEPELRALDALIGYGADTFLAVFYTHMGKAYLQPHEKGLRSLFAAIQADLCPILNRADAAKKAFALRDPVIRSRADHDALIARLTEKKDHPACTAN